MSEERLSRFFLRRLRHAAGAKALARAVDNGLLVRSELKLGSLMVAVFDVAVEVASLPLAILRRRLGLDGARRAEPDAHENDPLRHLVLRRRTDSPRKSGKQKTGTETRSRSAPLRTVAPAALDQALEQVVAELRASEAGRRAASGGSAPERSERKRQSARVAAASAGSASKTAAAESEAPVPGSSPAGAESAQQTATSEGKTKRSGRKAAVGRDREVRRLPRERFVRLVRRAALPPDPVEVATVLLLARAVGESGVPLADVLQRLSAPTPIVTLRSDVSGFEKSLVRLLHDGLVLPFAVQTHDGYGVRDFDGLSYPDGPKTALPIVAFRSRHGAYVEKGAGLVEDVARAVTAGMPILAVAEGERKIPADLQAATHLDLAVGPLDTRLIGQVIAEVLGPLRADLCEAIGDCSQLALADLATAIRPGVDPEHAVAVLARLAARRLEASASETGSDKKDEDDERSRSRRGKPSSGSELVEPEAMPTIDDREGQSKAPESVPSHKDDPSGTPWMSVETLSGYGAAKDWALAVKQDLALWREGKLDWSAMSTRILLSGPPGTGKTTFAKALGNSLQVPLLITSVANWLEPGYLGDVIKRMRFAFEEAEKRKPAILFIDEIDALGKRQSANGHYADYWNAVVNRALELLDGAKDHEGIVVVGATNRPGELDPALVRSGRLERHVRIDLPDTDALVGILAHHLGQDLPTVLETASGEQAADRSCPGDAGFRNAGTRGATRAADAFRQEVGADRGRFRRLAVRLRRMIAWYGKPRGGIA